MTASALDYEVTDHTVSLIEAVHGAMLTAYEDAPVVAAECALIAAMTLAALQGAAWEAIQTTAAVAWRVRHQHRIKVSGGSTPLTVSTMPDERRLALAEEILTLAHGSGMSRGACATTCLQMAAVYSSMSLAVTRVDFERAVRAAWERRGQWFELEATV